MTHTSSTLTLSTSLLVHLPVLFLYLCLVLPDAVHLYALLEDVADAVVLDLPLVASVAHQDTLVEAVPYVMVLEEEVMVFSFYFLEVALPTRHSKDKILHTHPYTNHITDNTFFIPSFLVIVYLNKSKISSLDIYPSACFDIFPCVITTRVALILPTLYSGCSSAIACTIGATILHNRIRGGIHHLTIPISHIKRSQVFQIKW